MRMVLARSAEDQAWQVVYQEWYKLSMRQKILCCRRVTNSVTQDVDTDSIRLRLIVPEANVIPQLTSLLHSTGKPFSKTGLLNMSIANFKDLSSWKIVAMYTGLSVSQTTH